jgi:predicted phage terminase large subunit-like protein
MTPEQIADCRCGLLDFTRTMFPIMQGGALIENWHQPAICNALERVVMGRTTRLIINVPPRSGKTELAVRNFMAWSMGLFSDSEFIHASYSKRLATSNTYAVRAMMQSREYLTVFPWVKIKDDSHAKDEFRTSDGGIIYATGSDGTITGYGAGKMRDGFGGAIVIDDPHKAGEATSDLQRQNVIDWFQMTMESRKNRPDTPIILIMQRLHEDDLTGWLLAGGNGEDWEHLKIPARNEAGESFWPSQFPEETLTRQEEASRYVFAGQYMQNPVPRGGAMFQREWFEVIPAAPANCTWIRGWDFAASEGTNSDWTAGCLMGRAPGGEFIIADMQRMRGTPAKVERLIRATATQDGPDVRGSIPQDPGQAGKAQAAYLIKQLAGYTYQATPETGDKETRAQPFAAQAEVGNVKLVAAAWVRPFLDEITSFPVGKHDDQVDAASRAFNELALANQVHVQMFRRKKR